ncbi:MBL fold metallo-hydrolase [Aureisphaera galaxeae]|uniref:MBL fold metallo-hydrolase n=1 Tax=Aureisphaera galaxeae TaxID=1538023 RepID=UPI002350EE98|nr:MBL fold metallo-hydrolase [Aureisphaera galaxeae]MDC8004316.1 MBL fold metallo-hydrolase [Aureisphaera galaxeae]
MLLILLGLIGILVIGYFLFVNLHPAFGGDVSKELKETYAKSDNHEDGKFINIDGVDDDITFGKGMKIMRTMLFNRFPNAKPDKELPMLKADSAQVADYNGSARLIWFGHSTFLLQAEGKDILIDPMLTDMPSPISRDAQRRFNKSLPIEIEQLPHIDAVLISHDHYDHLDYESIKRLREKVTHFFVPLGVGVHLEAWDVPKDRITEMDWWEETQYEGFRFACTPAQHFSGRKFNNRGSTLWASWVITSENNNIFFSGDSGYGEHFKAIGEKYGPFDFAMLECGQYNELWPVIHMMPEETAQAGVDVGARVIMPIHWGAFQLAMHDWDDPVKRVVKQAQAINIPVVVPKMGASIDLNTLDGGTYSKWW